MPRLVNSLPARRPDLVCWPVQKEGPYLVRNRSSGESFRIGEQEYFLLGQLDGRQTGDSVCRAFAGRFGQPLSEEELDEFLELAAGRGLLQPPGCSGPPETPTPPTAGLSATQEMESEPGVNPMAGSEGLSPKAGAFGREPATVRVRPPGKRMASLLLKIVSAILQGPGDLLAAAAASLDMLRLKHLEFIPRPDDIFIVTYPRSGTTWMQMILYQLTSDGRMNFPHIAEYCPWFEKSARSRQAFETRPSPRLFKSHLPYHKIPKGPCKYIYVARGGKDVAVSYYHLNRMNNNFDGTFAEFFDRFLKGKVSFGSWFRHVKGWWAHRDDPNVLFLTYEQLSRDLEGSLRGIAGFIGRPIAPERLAGILECCSFAFMKQHEDQFDPVVESLWEQGVQLKSFLRHGRIGDGAIHLTAEQQARFDQVFARRLGSTIPLGSADAAGKEDRTHGSTPTTA